MNSEFEINLSDYVDYPKTDWISGREFGEDKANKLDLSEKVNTYSKIVINVDDSVIKAINDSFIKGFFNKIFTEHRSKTFIDSKFIIKANPYFTNLFNKNFRILDAIYNSPSSK